MCSSINREFCWDRYKDWLIDIPGDLELALDQCCIYRVPKHIRKVNEEAYTPQIVSIGPFHYRKKNLEFMEKQKGRYVRQFFEQTTDEKREQVLAFVKDREKDIRNCYAETCNLQSHEYVKMILRDAIFIIELLRRYNDNAYNDNAYNDNASDSLLSIPAGIIALTLDLQLLENQLPYFLLEELYKLVASSPPFIDLCITFFGELLFDRELEETKFKHFTDLQRTALVKSYPTKKKPKQVIRDVDLPSAAKLHESGVKFKRADQMKCLLDIKFDVPELKIPQLRVYDETETILRNIMALEQCHYPSDTPICDYVELLDSLIDTKSDLDLLIKKEIISNCMGDSMAIVSLFNKLCTNIPLNRVYYNETSEKLKKHYDKPWNHTSAKLKSVYFSDLWRGTATVAAAVILLLTFIQTISSFTH